MGSCCGGANRKIIIPAGTQETLHSSIREEDHSGLSPCASFLSSNISYGSICTDPFKIKVMSDRPLYRAGDIAYFQVLFLDPITQQVLNPIQFRPTPSLMSLDKINKTEEYIEPTFRISFRAINYLTRKEIDFQSRVLREDQDVLNYSLVFQLLIPKSVPGGVYIAKVEVFNDMDRFTM